MNAMTEFRNLRIPFTIGDSKSHIPKHLEIEYDLETRSLWTFLKPQGNACFNPGLLADLQINDKIFSLNNGQAIINENLFPVNYCVLASRSNNIFNYGGDLALFITLINSRDRNGLLQYARACIECIYARIANYNSSAITISLIQGEALGGGFEYALTSNVLFAEESARMGFPEILFNLFPGMGAYSLLTRRIGAKKAEEIILEGKIYTARELYEIGLVDYLVPTGEGEKAVYKYMYNNAKRSNGVSAIYKCRNHSHPITYDELMSITEMWVDTALKLNERDLKMMNRLVQAQLRQREGIENKSLHNRTTKLAHEVA